MRYACGADIKRLIRRLRRPLPPKGRLTDTETVKIYGNRVGRGVLDAPSNLAARNLSRLRSKLIVPL